MVNIKKSDFERVVVIFMHWNKTNHRKKLQKIFDINTVSLILTIMSLSRSWEINQENVLETLCRAGGSLESRLVMGHFMSGVKDERIANKKSLNDLSTILRNVATMSKKEDNSTIWVLNKEFR